jgi:hypothetical protein
MPDDLTPKELSEAGLELVGGPDVDASGKPPKALEPDLAEFPWLAELPAKQDEA